MAEKQERRNVGEMELEGGQPSRNSGQTGREPEQHRIDIDEIWTESLKKARESTQSQSQCPRIPQMLRGTKDFEKLYEPRVISFGPYHHGKLDLHPGEMIKPLYAQKFLDDSKQDIVALYTKIESKIKAVKKCYDWSGTNKYNDEKLAWMMLLDGCFILQFIRSRVYHRTVDMSNVLRNHQINFVKQDLFLLENQLPFGVLKLIFEEAKFPGNITMEGTIEIFIKISITPNNGTHLEPEHKEPSHLLDLLRSAFLGRYKMISKQELGSPPEQEQEAEKRESRRGLEEEMGGSVAHGKKGKQQGIGQSEKKGKSSSSGGGDGEQRGIWKSFRHIKELKAAGIYLKPSRTSFLTDISFKSYFFCGYLKLPPISIDDFTKTKFLNMVAYEMCPDALVDYAVTSYVCFLYELIDDADDVKELRSKHILDNLLGSDEDVAKIFNEIGNDLGDPNVYKEVKTSIQNHYNKKVNTWIAEGLHDHFRSPWTFMALIAAVLILILTGLQTYYAHPGKHIIHIYMWLFGVAIFLSLVWYIILRLWDKLLSCIL